MNYVNHFRPIYEFRPFLVWPIVIVGILISGMPYGWAFSLVGAALLAIRALQIWKALSFRMAISTKWLSKIRIEKLLATQNAMRKRADSMYLGIGYEWTQKHTQIAHEILRMPVTDIPSLPKWLSKTETGRTVEARIERLRQEARQCVPLQGRSAAREQHWVRNETLHHKIEQVPLSLPRS